MHLSPPPPPPPGSLGCCPFSGGGSVVVDFLFIVTPIVGVCECSMFCCTLLYVHSSIAIILMRKRELAALFNLSSWCLMMVEWLFLAEPWGCLLFVMWYFLIILTIFETNISLVINAKYFYPLLLKSLPGPIQLNRI